MGARRGGRRSAGGAILMQSQQMFNDCIAEATGGNPTSAVPGRPSLSLKGLFGSRLAPPALVENLDPKERPANGKLETTRGTADEGPVAHSIMVWICREMVVNVLPSSERGEGSASHRTASSSEAPRHT